MLWVYNFRILDFNTELSYYTELDQRDGVCRIWVNRCSLSRNTQYCHISVSWERDVPLRDSRLVFTVDCYRSIIGHVRQSNGTDCGEKNNKQKMISCNERFCNNNLYTGTKTITRNHPNRKSKECDTDQSVFTSNGYSSRLLFWCLDLMMTTKILEKEIERYYVHPQYPGA